VYDVLSYELVEASFVFTFDPASAGVSGGFFTVENYPEFSRGEAYLDHWAPVGETVTISPPVDQVMEYDICWGATNGTIDACAQEGLWLVLSSGGGVTVVENGTTSLVPNAQIAFDASDVQAGGTRFIVIDAEDRVTNITISYSPEGTIDAASASYAAFGHAFPRVGRNLVHVTIRDDATGARHDYYYAINVTTADAAQDPRFNDCHAGPLCPGARAPGGGIQYQDWFITPAQMWAWIVWAFFALVAMILGWIILVRSVS
jgi:hypothetical protein